MVSTEKGQEEGRGRTAGHSRLSVAPGKWVQKIFLDVYEA
jgi:hypothetical protein